MSPSVYIETTVVSYLAARETRDVISLARRQLTTDWWNHRRKQFSLYLSSVVLDEAKRGDPAAARIRSRYLARLPLLDFNKRAVTLAEDFILQGALPENAADDAAHIAICAVHEMRFLLTWNFRHIANATIRSQLDMICIRHQTKLPVVCTPEEL